MGNLIRAEFELVMINSFDKEIDKLRVHKSNLLFVKIHLQTVVIGNFLML